MRRPPRPAVLVFDARSLVPLETLRAQGRLDHPAPRQCFPRTQRQPMKITADLRILIELTSEEVAALKEVLQAADPRATSPHGESAERLRVDLLASLPAGE